MPILTKEALNIAIPKMVPLRQVFDNAELSDIKGQLNKELDKASIKSKIKPGSRIAVAVGSRGIYQIDKIVKCLIRELKNLKAKPFIVPAMGSHGGASSGGQRDVLAGYGITEELMECPIISSMDVVEVGITFNEIPLYMDKEAYNSDLIIPVARIKPHTDFKGRIESGLCKMITIGLGKHIGCSRLHQEGFDNFERLIPEAAKIVLETGKIGFGIAILENAYDKTAEIHAVLPEEFIDIEEKLLIKAKKLMPSIMVPDIDVLIIREIGKDISGAGMDPNIVGRTTKGMLPGYNGPKIKRIIVLDITEDSHGNACGIGLADFTVKGLIGKIEPVSTYANVIASGNPEAGRIPVTMENELDAIKAAIISGPQIDINNPKIVKIKNTLHLEDIEVSENMINSIKDNKRLKNIE